MGIVLPSLYPHQEKLRDDTRAALLKHRSVILCAMPGVGKTRLSKWILGKSSMAPPNEKRSGRVLFCVHRRGLVDNASNSFMEEPTLDHGVIMSQREAAWGKSVQVGSIDSLLSWFCEGGDYRGDYTFDFISFDESHSHASKLRTFLECHNRKREELGLCEPFVLGLSATPSGEHLSDIFEEIVFGPSTKWLIENKFLKPYRYFRATEGKLDKLVKRGDDFSEASIAEAMSGLAGDLVRDWKKHAEGRATVGFFPRRQHAYEAMEILRANGVAAEYVDGTTPDDERNEMFKRLNRGDIIYIANVGIIERGTDIPRIGCVQICTAVGNIARYIQLIGRGSRPHPDVPDCLVLDHGGCVKRHGFFDDEIAWTLDHKQRPAKTHQTRATMACPVCSAIYRGGRCSSCGFEPSKKQLLSEGLQWDGRELTEVRPRDRKEKKVKTPEQYMVAALYQAGKSNKTFAQAIGIAKRNAEKDGASFVVPKKFTVAGKSYQAVPYGDDDSKRRVADVYGFTVGQYGKNDNPYCLGPAQTTVSTNEQGGFLFDE